MLESGFHGRPGEGRQIALALVVSLAIHALILVSMPGPKNRAPAPRPDPLPLIAHLMAQQPPPAQPTHVADVRKANPEKTRPPGRAAAQAAPPPRSPILEPSPRPAETPVVTQSPAPVSAAVGLPAQPVTRGATPATVAKVVPVEASGARVPAPAAETIDTASLGQYRSALIAAARRYRKYPRIAVENSWEGRAEVRLTIDSNGGIASISIRTR